MKRCPKCNSSRYKQTITGSYCPKCGYENIKMKEQITRTKFTCDNCGRVTEELSEFPYELYLYLISIKLDKGKERTIKDRHFCSKDCFKQFINSRIIYNG